MQVEGNEKQLFSMHGVMTANKAVTAFQCMSDTQVLNIEDVNKTSQSGGLYITYDGKILDYFDDSSERLARYKIVPTGIKAKDTNYPLFASFIKLNNFWEGVFIGTGVQLFDMYKKHFNSGAKFSEMYLNVFAAEHRAEDIRGFGLKEVLENREEDALKSKAESVDVYTDASDTSQQQTALALAIQKMEVKNSKNSKGSHKNKNQRKVERLKLHLEKMQQRQQRQAKATEVVENNNIETDETKKEEVAWTSCTELEEPGITFEDNATKEFNRRVEAFINGSSEYSEYDYKDSEEIVEGESKPEETYNEQKMLKEVLGSLDHDLIENNSKQIAIKYQMKNDLAHDIYERLLIKENWMFDNKPRLSFYLKGICLMVWYNQYKDKDNTSTKGNGYTYSKDRTKAVINTGLLDKFGNFIYLVDHTPLVPDFLDKRVHIMVDKYSLIKFGFELIDIRNLPEPIRIVDDLRSLVFDANIEDFDLDDDFHLQHIINERRYRFPEKYKNASDMELCNKIKNAIIQGVKISKLDTRYAIPTYDFSRHNVQFLLPLYLDNSLDKTAELAIVVGRYNEMWKIYTVLLINDAYDDARLLSNPKNTWIDITKQKHKQEGEKKA